MDFDVVHVGLVSVAAAAGGASPAIPPAAASADSRSSRTAVSTRRRNVEYRMAGCHPLSSQPARSSCPGQGPEMISIVIVDV